MSRNVKPIVVVQGAQWGSEAKGMVAAALCQHRKINYAVRTGAINAGHTVYRNGTRFVNQQLPTGWVNEGTALVLGPGAYINPAQLAMEVEMIKGAGWNGQIYIDRQAGLHLPQHTERAQRSNRHYKIGATGKGCSEAIIDRIRLRGQPDGELFIDWWRRQWEQPWMESIHIGDTVALLHRAYDKGDQILLEGTQGTLLDLYLGPYPYTTHKQCLASQWVTEAGLAPGMEYETVLVARTFPIRVAGNSGPMPREIDWVTLASEINAKRQAQGLSFIVDPSAVLAFQAAYDSLNSTVYATPEVEKSERNRDALGKLPDAVVTELKKLFEFTTVTRKLRRIARLDRNLLKYSVMVNRPKWVCLTFLNYEFPESWGLNLSYIGKDAMQLQAYLNGIEYSIGCPIGALTFGPETQHLQYINASIHTPSTVPV